MNEKERHRYALEALRGELTAAREEAQKYRDLLKEADAELASLRGAVGVYEAGTPRIRGAWRALESIAWRWLMYGEAPVAPGGILKLTQDTRAALERYGSKPPESGS